MRCRPEHMERDAFERDASAVAPWLLNKLLQSTTDDGVTVTGRIIEVEAYTQDDPASHTFRGRTPRNAIMFGRAGHAYVYTSYGIHQCLNVVTGPVGDGQAVLIRAVEPLGGIKTIIGRRSQRPRTDLTNGPGKVGQAFAVTGRDNGTDLLDPSSTLRIIDDDVPPPTEPPTGPRIGISKAVDTPWRFRVPRIR